MLSSLSSPNILSEKSIRSLFQRCFYKENSMEKFAESPSKVIPKSEIQKAQLLLVDSGHPSNSYDLYKEVEFSYATIKDALNGISTNQITPDAVVVGSTL